ncbi:hypothetical protein FGO68_gene16115 [Halteria grandinella]|uniref:Uncharacterized protein n=1 Tax=Halteria grandinella TaxID=5974 RepID=A0A8J8NAJ9_HALGN|nr:hypothetical protein FGO68_gene16115 [Halteria grandinella]
MESLILAQDERQRQAQYMQVERCSNTQWRTGAQHVCNLPYIGGQPFEREINTAQHIFMASQECQRFIDIRWACVQLVSWRGNGSPRR